MPTAKSERSCASGAGPAKLLDAELLLPYRFDKNCKKETGLPLTADGEAGKDGLLVGKWSALEMVLLRITPPGRDLLN